MRGGARLYHMVMRIAVVIPTLNEAVHLPVTLAAVAQGRPDLVVVADCGSSDATVSRARHAGVEVISDPTLSSRAAALDVGWRHVRRAAASGEPLDAVWFLHADTAPPASWRSVIESTLADPRAVGGAFAQRFVLREGGAAPTWTQRRLLRFVIFCNRCRYRLTGIYFGDQGLFVRPAVLERVGGIPDVTLMEDVELCRRLRREGRVCVSRERLSTSPRRFLQHGIIRQLLHDWRLLIAHRLGRRPEHLYRRYNEDNQRAVEAG